MNNNTQFSRSSILKIIVLAAITLHSFGVKASIGQQTMLATKDSTDFNNIHQIKAGVLNIGYAALGPANGQPVILLHGWPYDIHSYEKTATILSEKGYRVLVPHLRGHGTTTFLNAKTFRNGQQAAVANDIIAFMDALNIKTAILGGFDWGARTADIIAALWPERCKALVSVNGYLINSLEKNRQPLPPKAEWGWWYQYYFATERGKIGYSNNWYDFNRLIWKNISPKWNFDEATYERSAASFKNPDYAAIVIHNYRWRLSLEPGEKQYDAIEQKLATSPTISVPTVTLDGDADGVVPASDGSAFAKKFTGKHVHHIIAGAGHNLPQEAPEAFANAIIEADRLAK